MFSQVSFCLGGGGVSAPLHAGIHIPQADTPWADIPPPSACWDTPPTAQCMLGYGQQAGCTHPTGMHSCCNEECGRHF